MKTFKRSASGHTPGIPNTILLYFTAAGLVKESGRKAGLKQYDEEPYADNVYEYDGYGLQFQQEGGLEGAKVWGQLLFNTQTAQGRCTAAGSPQLSCAAYMPAAQSSVCSSHLSLYLVAAGAVQHGHLYGCRWSQPLPT